MFWADCTGLGSVASSSLQQQFDGAISSMRLLHTHAASAAAALDAISHICLDPTLREQPASQIDQVTNLEMLLYIQSSLI